MLLNKFSRSPIIDIIIVNWNAGTQLHECLISVAQYGGTYVNQIIIIDNASTDNSLESIKSVNLPLTIIRNETNRGFAVACNQGAALVSSEYLLFLNPDTRLFEGSLNNPINFMYQEKNANVGICGIRLVDEQGNFSTSAARFPTLRVMMGKILGLTHFFPLVFPSHLMAPSELHEDSLVEQVIGAFFLIRRNVFELCHGFDEQFFVYFEEVDLSLRAKQLGYSSYFLSGVSAFHKGGGCSEKVKSVRLFYSLRSRIIYAKKHYSQMEFTILVLLTGLELPLRVVQGVLQISWSNIKNTFAAYKSLLVYFFGEFDETN